MSRADILAKFTDVLAGHTIECTGLGEVTCRGCRDRGWMSWSEYRAHVAAVLTDALTDELAAAWRDGLDVGKGMAHIYGHTDNWPDVEPQNPYDRTGANDAD